MKHNRRIISNAEYMALKRKRKQNIAYTIAVGTLITLIIYLFFNN